MKIKTDPISKHAVTYSVVGELVMIANAIDHLLNRVLIEAFSLEKTPMLEPVVATLDARQKIEMLKIRKKLIKSHDWSKAFAIFCDKAEAVYRQRNIVCHTPAFLEGQSWVFKPAVATKMLSRLDLEKKLVKDFPFDDIKRAIATGEAALGAGVHLLENLERFNVERRRRGIGKPQ